MLCNQNIFFLSQLVMVMDFCTNITDIIFNSKETKGDMYL